LASRFLLDVISFFQPPSCLLMSCFGEDMSKKKDEGNGIPPLVVDCIREIRARGLHEDGILRVSGSAAQIKELQNAYRKGKRIDLSNVYIHTIGGVLKNYFRDMPKPILTYESYDDFLAVSAMENEEEKVKRLRYLISQLPMENQELLHKIIIFILEVSKYADENQMHLANLATMFGPTFLRKKEQERAALLQDLQDVIAVTHTMLTNNMFEAWPDEQDRHPFRPQNAALDKEQVRKVKEAVSSWYGSPDWEKESRRRQAQPKRKLPPARASNPKRSMTIHTPSPSPKPVENGPISNEMQVDEGIYNVGKKEPVEEENDEENETGEKGKLEEKKEKEEEEEEEDSERNSDEEE